MAGYWASVPDAPEYLVSEDGEVRRMLPAGTWRALKPSWNRRAFGSDGYLKVCLGRRRQEYLHRLVWLAHLGPIPDDTQVDHRNGDRADNRIENLRLLPSEVNSPRHHPISRAWDADTGEDAA